MARSSELSLRLAGPLEAPAIAHLSRDLIEYGLRWRWTPERVAASIRARDVNVLGARIEGSLVGFGIMRYGEEDAHLDLFAVIPGYRRARVGRRLLEWLEKCALVAGIFRVTLEVREKNVGGQLFYEHMGYRPLTRIPGYYQGVEAALRMGRELSSRSLDSGTRETQQKMLEKIFGTVSPVASFDNGPWH